MRKRVQHGVPDVDTGAVFRLLHPAQGGGGDAEFDGNGPAVNTWSQLFGIGTNQLQVRIAMDAIETIQDFTHASGLSGWFVIFVAPAGQCIESVSRTSLDQIADTDTDTAVDDFPGATAGSLWPAGRSSRTPRAPRQAPGPAAPSSRSA
jgi:hypothetical protein